MASCYPDEMGGFPDELQSLLQQHTSALHPDVRLVREEETQAETDLVHSF